MICMKKNLYMKFGLKKDAKYGGYKGDKIKKMMCP